jgi:hypothetical protein
MHAHAAENLLPSLPAGDFKGGAILDVGSGSGYRKLKVRSIAYPEVMYQWPLYSITWRQTLE